ncbi:MAG: hypothetical protein Ta2D_00850 [Rickettsiales bacterium]|nr:MAG: hypothetical protein Ta2D_00850 [Rickettsiales bacterium]
MDTLIKKFFPKIVIQSRELITNGWESDILIINKQQVFRFPKQNNRFDIVYDKEKTITDTIRPFLTTPITKMDIYREGIFKKKILFSLLDYIDGIDYENSDKPDITTDLVCFLKELHSIDVKIFKNYEKLNAVNLPFYKYKLTLDNLPFEYDTLSPLLKKYDLEQDFNDCIKIFTNFEWDDKDNVICHNDLHQGNIMVKDGKITGIIDFGDTIYTNYNVEFVSILKWKDSNILKNIIGVYEKETGRKIDIKFIIAVLKLQTYLKLNFKNDDEKYLNRLKNLENKI